MVPLVLPLVQMVLPMVPLVKHGTHAECLLRYRDVPGSIPGHDKPKSYNRYKLFPAWYSDFRDRSRTGASCSKHR